MALAEKVMPVVASILGIVACLNVVASWLLLRRFRARQPEEWQALGRPTLFTWPIGRAASEYRRFLWGKGQVSAFGDSQLVLWRRVITVTGYLALLSFLVYWVLAVVVKYR